MVNNDGLKRKYHFEDGQKFKNCYVYLKNNRLFEIKAYNFVCFLAVVIGFYESEDIFGIY